MDCGGRVISGLELLLYQGIDQLELVLESSFDREGMAGFVRRRLIEAAK
jgi:shikimate dehydrogenase